MNTSDLGEDHFFAARYLLNTKQYSAQAPTLKMSLTAFDKASAFQWPIDITNTRPSCLIQGYTAPQNESDLRSFLASKLSNEINITAVDKMNLPVIYEKLGVEFPRIEFFQMDASELWSTLKSRHFDLLIQDFILNCAPLSKSRAIVTEGARLLKPGALAFISFTDNSNFLAKEALTPHTLLHNCGVRWNSNLTSLEQLLDHSQEAKVFDRQDLLGKVIYDQALDHYTVITNPTGRFEYFAPLKETLSHFDEAGLRVLHRVNLESVDYSGLMCSRHHCLLVKTS